MAGTYYFHHEIDHNPTALDVGKIKASGTIVLKRHDDDHHDPVKTFSITWLAEDVIEYEGFDSKIDLNLILMEACFPYDQTMFLLTEEVRRRIVEITSSSDYSTDFALNLWLSFHDRPPPSSFEYNSYICFRPTNKLVVESLIRKIYIKTNSRVGDKCAICLEEFQSGGRVVTLPCGHEFDDHCVVDWLATSHFCPLCRFKFPREDQ